MMCLYLYEHHRKKIATERAVEASPCQLCSQRRSYWLFYGRGGIRGKKSPPDDGNKHTFFFFFCFVIYLQYCISSNASTGTLYSVPNNILCDYVIISFRSSVRALLI